MPIVTMFGGSGFIGRYAARKLARRGWRVRAAVRRPNEAHFLRPYGDVGQIEPVQANIRDEDSCRRALEGADAVVNFVGILSPSGKQSFDAVQAEGAGRVARLAAEAGVRRFTQVSAIGADPRSDADYARTKGEGEALVRAAMPEAAILRPSIVFGEEDAFFNRFARMAQFTPVLPVAGGETRFQPVYVDDVAEAAVRSLEGEIAAGRIFELGGPEVLTMKELMELMLRITQRKRVVADVPMGLMRFGAALTDWLPFAPVTRDQLKMLAHDNVASGELAGFEAFGIEPKSLESVLPGYLYRFRPYGQYARMEKPARPDEA
ncbi:complex I NDUFA9 subunit family protein [Neomegalonema sp.]|uniref:complex I NDUFA9 subunit family protein n=1 Tax=Neomegalonema sp. TaxID=2039713 RepID=UPI002626CDA0|nr:complex I NDUFA9 subunit family protein [Neomegalonema sp.]MDD2868871.1 complex I NDUFA9 subunit family protein [Neomegalonema sp.]